VGVLFQTRFCFLAAPLEKRKAQYYEPSSFFLLRSFGRRSFCPDPLDIALFAPIQPFVRILQPQYAFALVRCYLGLNQHTKSTVNCTAIRLIANRENGDRSDEQPLQQAAIATATATMWRNHPEAPRVIAIDELLRQAAAREAVEIEDDDDEGNVGEVAASANRNNDPPNDPPVAAQPVPAVVYLLDSDEEDGDVNDNGGNDLNANGGAVAVAGADVVAGVVDGGDGDANDNGGDDANANGDAAAAAAAAVTHAAAAAAAAAANGGGILRQYPKKHASLDSLSEQEKTTLKASPLGDPKDFMSFLMNFVGDMLACWQPFCRSRTSSVCCPSPPLLFARRSRQKGKEEAQAANSAKWRGD